jgi:hypothetical protein
MNQEAEKKPISAEEADLAKVRAATQAKEQRHRADDWVAIVLGVGVCLFLWILQWIGVY